MWTSAGTFAPLTVLCVASAGLVTVLYRSRTAAVASPRRYPCTRVTATVTAVVLTFILYSRPCSCLALVLVLVLVLEVNSPENVLYSDAFSSHFASTPLRVVRPEMMENYLLPFSHRFT